MPTFVRPIEIEDFEPRKLQTTAPKSSPLCLYKNRAGNWYVKQIRGRVYEGYRESVTDAAYRAYREVVAQEFFRLIIPTQPKTLFGKGLYKGKPYAYVLSREVTGFRAIFERIDPNTEPERYLEEFKNKMEQCANGTLKNFGEILITAIFLEEVDLKNGNLGIDSENNVVKIDGDHCFATLIKKYENLKLVIDKNLLENLPYTPEYQAFNWLKIKRQNGYLLKECETAREVFSRSEIFRAQVNKAILKISLLSDRMLEELIGSFILQNISALYNSILTKMTERRDQLITSALQLESFRDFILSEEANAYVFEYFSQLMQFDIQGNVIYEIANNDFDIASELTSRLEELKGRAQQIIEELRTPVEAEAENLQSTQEAEELKQLKDDFKELSHSAIEIIEKGDIINIQRLDASTDILSGDQKERTTPHEDEEKKVEEDSYLYRFWNDRVQQLCHEENASLFRKIAKMFQRR